MQEQPQYYTNIFKYFCHLLLVYTHTCTYIYHTFILHIYHNTHMYIHIAIYNHIYIPHRHRHLHIFIHTYMHTYLYIQDLSPGVGKRAFLCIFQASGGCSTIYLVFDVPNDNFSFLDMLSSTPRHFCVSNPTPTAFHSKSSAFFNLSPNAAPSLLSTVTP